MKVKNEEEYGLIWEEKNHLKEILICISKIIKHMSHMSPKYKLA